MTSIHVDRVSVSLGGAEILHEVSLDAASGTRTALVGASGSGKSTLLRVIAGFEEPSAGTVSLDDRRVSGEGRLVPAHRRGISYVPQEGALFPHLTVAGNIAFGLGGGRIRDPRVAEVADLVALDRDLLTRRPHELSGGQQQRVALARALAPRPDVVLLDEPFSALDAGLRDATRAAVVAALEATGVTAVMVTHDRAEALEFGHGLGVIEAGRIAESGDPRSLYEAPASLATARFLGPALVVGGALDGEAVTTALGRLTVGADRTASGASAGGAVLVLIRPEQVALVAGPPAGGTAVGGTAVGATVASLVEIGSRVTATLTLADGAAVSLDLPRVVAPRLAVGGSASVTVSGRVAVYDA